MGNFHAFESQMRGPSATLPSSFAPLVRPFAPVPSSAPVSAPHHAQASLEHARRFGHSLERLSLFPPVHHAAPQVHEDQQTGHTEQQNRSVQNVSQASMESRSAQPVQAEKRPHLGWNIAHVPLFPDPATLPLKKNTTGLPDSLKVGVESLSGLSLDDVHVHYNSSKPAQVQALAYTQGTEIYVGPGQEQHLAHEAWHVVQQKQGRVKPTLQAKDVAMNDDQVLEREANAMGERVNGGAQVFFDNQRERKVTQQMKETKSSLARHNHRKQNITVTLISGNVRTIQRCKMTKDLIEGNKTLDDKTFAILNYMAELEESISNWEFPDEESEENQPLQTKWIGQIDKLYASFSGVKSEDELEYLTILLDAITMEYSEKKRKPLTSSVPKAEKKEAKTEETLPDFVPPDLKKLYKLQRNDRQFDSLKYKDIMECAKLIKNSKEALLHESGKWGPAAQECYNCYEQIIQIVQKCSKCETEKDTRTYWTMLQIELVGNIKEIQKRAGEGMICNEELADAVINALSKIK
jgi:hypothetical protein